MLIRQAPDIRSSEITPERLYRNRREFIRTATGAVAGAMAAGTPFGPEAGRVQAQEPFPDLRKSPLSTDEPLNSLTTSRPTTTSTSSGSTRAIRPATPTR